MKKFLMFLTLLVILAAIGMTYFFHIVRTSDDILLVQKEPGTFSNTYLDTRSWSLFDYAKYPSISRKLMSDSLDRLTDRVSAVLEDSNKQIDRFVQEMNDLAEKNQDFMDQVDDLQKEFSTRWARLQREYESCETEEAFQNIEKKRKELISWFNKKLTALKEDIQS